MAERDPFALARKQYPWIANIPHVYHTVPGRRNLEAWPPGEPGTVDYPRPTELPLDQFSLEIFDRSIRPEDVMGDIVSHGTRFSDETVRNMYAQFAASITPQQERMLQQQYAWSRENDEERRPYAHWREQSGLPAHFRGYTFQQTGDFPGTFEELANRYYTGDQRNLLDALNQYLRQKR
jgi:hypothetical protein